MKNQLDIFQCASKSVFVRNTALNKINVAANFFNVLPIAGRKIIDDANTSAARDQRRRDMRTNKTGASGYQRYP